MSHQDQLQKVFLDAHRDFIKGLRTILQSLEKGDVVAASAAAEKLDRIAGPHIEFEETVFYPLLVKPLGRDVVSELYQEHAAGLAGMRRLVPGANPEEMTIEDRQFVTEQIQIALDHATSCGTLLSHVAALEEESKAEILASLREIEARPRRWTELHPRGSEPQAPPRLD